MAGVIGKIGGVFSNFDANFLASKFGIFASQIAASKTPTEIIDTETALGSSLGAVANKVIAFIYRLIYFICKFALSLVDFLEAIVKKLAGISATGQSYSVNNDLNSNPIFKFLLNDTVFKVFLSLVGFAILMLIIFVIISIVKTEYDAATDDKSNNKGPIARRAMKSLFLFVCVPIFLFIFVFASNAVLNSANAAFKRGTNSDTTLGGSVFIASTYEANKFRNYANRGTRAPITFAFEDPAETNFTAVMTPEEIRDAYASWEGAKQLYQNFASSQFDDFSDTVVYRNGKVYNSSSYSGFENFVTTAEEYYVLADFLDYAVTNALEYYIKPLDDSDIDWDAVKTKIGPAMYYSILEDMKFSVAYRDVYDINGNGEYDVYLREYVNEYGSPSSPVADALRTTQMILGVGDYSENTFRMLERVPGYVNYVRWASEMAYDEETGETMRVYEITKYTYNTLIEEIQAREPQLCVQYNGQYFAVRKLQSEEEHDGVKCNYICKTGDESTKIDRVSVAQKLVTQNGEEYLNSYGETIMVPKDDLAVKYKKVSWPEKLYNDLVVVYGDIFRDALVNGNGDWMTIQTTSGVSASSSGSINIPTAFISPSGLIMSELFLGTRLENEEGISAANATYGSVYSGKTLDAVLKTVEGEENYVNLKGQIEAFEAIFDNMMSAILDDVASQEGVTDVDDSVSMNTYKQYLASIMMSQEFADYFGDLARCIVFFNQILYEFNQNKTIAAYTMLGDAYKAVIDNDILGVLDDTTIAYGIVNDYKNDRNSYYKDTSLYSGPITYNDSVIYDGWNTLSFYAVRSAEDVTLAGVDLEAYLSDLYSQRDSAYVKCNLFATSKDSRYVKNLKEIDAQIFSAYKFILKSSFRDAVTTKTSKNLNITLNGNSYNVLLTLSTTQIAEYAFGNQLKDIAPDFYDSDLKFTYVDPAYSGLLTVTYSDENNKSIETLSGFSTPFVLLHDFAKDFGDISFELNNSNFVKMAYGAKDTLVGEEFYNSFANYIVNSLFAEFPDVARTAGVVSETDALAGSGIAVDSVVSWKLTNFDSSSGIFTAEIYYGTSVEDDENVYIFNKIQATNEFYWNRISNRDIARALVEYWGFEFENSQYGFSYPVIQENDIVYAVVDGVRYYAKTVNYRSINANNSVVISNNASENIYSGVVIEFANGNSYLVDTASETVVIGAEVVGKTFVDYRRDAMQNIAYLESRAGETDLELSDRFLSMFYLLCAEINDDNTISTDIYSKRVIKRLSGEENRPDENLVGKEYLTDFGGLLRDENRGTVFIICTYDKTTEKFVPFLAATKSASLSTFVSKYLVDPADSGALRYYPIVARGVIDTKGNPTAIRQKENGDIEFYRDNIYIVNASNLGISMYYQSIEDVRVKNSIVSSIVNGVTKLFTGKTLTQMIVENIPRLSADSTLKFAYGSKEVSVATAEDGQFLMGYNFKTLGIDYFYSVGDLNIIVLLFGTILIVSALFAAVWGLIHRIWDITVLFLIAPPVIATLPLTTEEQDSDSKSGKFARYMAWRDKMISSVLSVYGIVIGLNVFFLFVPLISDLAVFDSSYATNGIIQKFGGVDFVNYLFRVIFLFAAIGLIRRAPKMLQPLISGGKDQDIFSKGEATQSNVRATVETVKDHVSGQYIHDKAIQMAGAAKNMIPGSAIAAKGIEAGGKVKDFAVRKTAEYAAIANGVPRDVAKQASQELAKQMSNQRTLKKNEKVYREHNMAQREMQRTQIGDRNIDAKTKEKIVKAEAGKVAGLGKARGKASSVDKKIKAEEDKKKKGK